MKLQKDERIILAAALGAFLTLTGDDHNKSKIVFLIKQLEEENTFDS